MENRNQIVVDIEERLAGIKNRRGLCLYYANHTMRVLQEHGLRAVLQAGSLQWPRITPEQDDGISNTHFAYMWTPTEQASRLSVALGCLPEMHVWVGIIDTQEIVDFTTRHLRAECEARDMTWTAPDPPPYLWCSVKNIPSWTVYEANKDATLYAYRVWHYLCDTNAFDTLGPVRA